MILIELKRMGEHFYKQTLELFFEKLLTTLTKKVSHIEIRKT